MLLAGELTLPVEDAGSQQADQQAGAGGAQQQQEPPLPPGPAGATPGVAAVEDGHLQGHTGRL